MASYIPVSGTFSVFATRFVSPALGFTLGEFNIASYTSLLSAPDTPSPHPILSALSRPTFTSASIHVAVIL